MRNFVESRIEELATRKGVDIEARRPLGQHDNESLYVLLKELILSDHEAAIKEAEQQVAELRGMIDEIMSIPEIDSPSRDGSENAASAVRDAITSLRDEIIALTEENKRLREVLEKLARLGNEPMLGNSIGNVIAQAVLSEKEAL